MISHLKKSIDMHRKAIKHIFRFFKCTAAYSIEYTLVAAHPCHFIKYFHFDFVNNFATRKSPSGYVFKIGNDPVTWGGHK